MSSSQSVVALYVTCLVNSLRPDTGHASVALLHRAGFQVVAPPSQTCCGQPAYNNGLEEEARALARQQIEILEPFAAVVVPSGACTGMIRVHYPRLFAQDAPWHTRARALAEKTFELGEFLHRNGFTPASQPGAAPTAHHTSCSCRREAACHQADDALLAQALGEALKPFVEPEVCCGFGGTFAARFDDLSAHLGTTKLNHLLDAGVTRVVSADPGCLLHLQGLAQRQNRPLTFVHLAEALQDPSL